MPASQDQKRASWNGVRWAPVRDGKCVRHGTDVGPVTKLCADCNREQLEAAKNGSREFEISKSDTRDV